MANLSITSSCQKSCAYCFAREAFSRENNVPAHMPAATFRRALAFLKRSGINQVRLLGGEPTLHPDFPLLLKEAAGRNPDILLFSNGLISKESLCAIEAIPERKIKLLINATGFAPSGKPIPALIKDTLTRLRERVMLGVNISTPAVHLDTLIDIVDSFHLSRNIRLGLAHPCLGGHNRFLRPRQYPQAGEMIARFAAHARKQGIHIELDCGFVPCMFPEGFLEAPDAGAQETGRRCNPVLDILPDGTIVSCYPLAALGSFPLKKGIVASGLREKFLSRLRQYGQIGIFRECSSCRLFAERLCYGGCRAAAVNRLRSAAAEIAVPAKLLRTEDRHSCTALRRNAPIKEMETGPSGQWMIPYIDQPLPFWQSLAEEFSGRIDGVYFPVPGGLIASGRPRQPEKHLNRFLGRSPFDLHALVNSVVLPRPVDEAAPEIIERLKRLQDEFGIRGVTVASLPLARKIREALPALSITASTLMDICRPQQAAAASGICDTLVPASRIMRDASALADLKKSFAGKIRLIVNEACLPDCVFRVQHFFEMAIGTGYPQSLCRELLEDRPWLRLTGAWVLPQHLHLFDGLYDGLKLAGRVTLRDPSNYRRVLAAYVNRTDLMPHETGGGPASMTTPVVITEEFYKHTLACKRDCHQCAVCRDYFNERHPPSPGKHRKRIGRHD